MAVSRERILELLAESPTGISLQEIAKSFNTTTDQISPMLTALKRAEWVDNPEPAHWRITDKGLQRGLHRIPTVQAAPQSPYVPETGPIMEPGDVMVNGAEDKPSGPVPGAYEKFAQIGRSLGLREDFLKNVCDYIFTGDIYDMNFIWDALNGLYLRPDVTKRWFNMWSRVTKAPVPTEIAAQILPPTTPSGKEAAKEAEVKSPTRFSVIGDEIVADPDGEFTFSMARQYLMTKLVQGAAPQLGGEKVSEIIAAISPFMLQQQSQKVAEIEAQGETSILGILIKSLIESQSNGQPPMTMLDMLTVIEKLEAMRRVSSSDNVKPDAFSELERMLNMFTMMKNMFGGGQTSSPITIALKGENGQTGALPLETYFQLEDHRRAVKREDEEAENKRETGKTVRGFFDKISKAASNMASRQ